jgi:cell division protein FtsQ
MSSIFNIKQIIVSNNNKISSDEIINLSGLKTEINMFKMSKRNISNNVKVNPYIENIKIKRSLKGVITLEVEEIMKLIR